MLIILALLIYRSHESQATLFVSRFMESGTAALSDDLLASLLVPADRLLLNQSQQRTSKTEI